MEYWIEVEQDVHIYVEDLNPTGKETILFLHGWPLNHKAFEYQYNVLPFQGFRCIGIDMRGFGKSSKPISGYDYNRMSDDVFQVIEALGLENITLAGHSMGAAIAVRYMARHNQEHVQKLALFAGAVPSIIRRPGFDFGLSKSSLDEWINETYQNRPQMLRKFSDLFFFQFITQSISDWFISLGLEAAGYSTALSAIALRDETTFNDITKITVPTVIMHGVHDKVCLYALAVYTNEQIKSSRLISFELSGHELFYEEKDKFNRELMDFVRE